MPSRKRLLAYVALSALLGALSAQSRAQADDFVPRYAHTATLLPDGDILIAGGVIDSANNATASIQRYNTKSAMFKTVTIAGPAAFVARASHTATLLPDGRVAFVGGINNHTMVTGLSYVQIYDPVTNALENGLRDVGATGRYNHTATLLPNGKVLIAGGDSADPGPAPTQTSQLLNALGTTAAEQLADGPDMGMPRAEHYAVLLADKRVLVGGGYTSGGEYAVPSELYSYSYGTVGRWSADTTDGMARVNATALQMGDGRIMVAGGFNGQNVEERQGYLEKVQTRVPGDAGWSSAAPMKARKAYASSVLLGDGKVAVMGGLGNITTSYTHASLVFSQGSALQFDPASAGQPDLDVGWYDAKILPSGSDETMKFPMTGLVLGTPVTGRIAKGKIAFSQGHFSLSDVDVAFEYTPHPLFTNDTIARLDGVDVLQGIMADRTVALSSPNGIGRWKPRASVASAQKNILATTSLALTAPIAGGGGDPGTLDSLDGASHLDVPIDISMPASDFCGNGLSYVVKGNAKIVGGQIEDTVNQYTVALTGGESEFVNCVGNVNPKPNNGIIEQDAVTGTHLACNFQFHNVAGGVTNTNPDPLSTLNGPLQPTVPLENLTMNLLYQVSCVDAKDTSFTSDITTITIQTMIFGDEEVYDPSQNIWNFGAPMGVPRFNASATLLPNGDSVLIGGRACSGTAKLASECYGSHFDPLPKELHPSGYILQAGTDGGTGDAFLKPNLYMAAKRRNHSATVLPDGKILIAGGADGPVTVSKAELYDPKTFELSAAGTMGVGRAFHSSTLLPNGTVLVAGGYRGQPSTGATNSAEIFYPETRSWVATMPMISSRSHHTATLLPSGNVFVFGGFGEDGEYVQTYEIYHTTSMVWEQFNAPASPVACKRDDGTNNLNCVLPRAEHTATLLQTGNILISGGINNTKGVLGERDGETLVYHPDTNSFTSDTNDRMPSAAAGTKRYGHTATLLQDGRVLVAGGNAGFGVIGRGVTYDPAKAGTRWAITDTYGSGPGRDMIIPRSHHAAQLLPNGKVLFTGGFDDNGPVRLSEGYDVAFSSWQLQGRLQSARGYHTSVVTADGNVVVVGGYDGIQALNTVEYMYFTYSPDESTKVPLPRQPLVTAVSTGAFDRGGFLTVYGSRFDDMGEASGGSAASANSHHSHPRLYLQAMDSTGNNGGAAPGFSIDLTSAVYYQKLNISRGSDAASKLAGWQKWSSSSMTVIVPTSPGLLPYGWYHLRVAGNSQFADALAVQAGPPRPSQAPGIPYGALTGINSVTWNWTPVSGTPDGYNVYSATSGVFISSVSPSSLVNGKIQFIQTGLGPDTSGLIRVAAYTLSGDGPVSVATAPITTLSAKITGVQGVPTAPDRIVWSWANNEGASSYNIFSGSAPDSLMGTASGPSWPQTGLNINSPYGIFVQAVTPAGSGELTASPTVYTLAAPPVAAVPSLINVTSTSFDVVWDRNNNPTGTTYVLRRTQISDYGVGPASSMTVTGISGTGYSFTGLLPNVQYQVEVAAVNGNSRVTGYTPLGSTATFAAPPCRDPMNCTLTLSNVTPSSFQVDWDRNNNSASTRFQVTYSTDGFVGNFSTAVFFGSNFTQTSTVLSDLITGASYTVRVAAMNYYGQVTAFASSYTLTDNGGGEPGTLSLWVPKDSPATMQATIGDNGPTRTVSLKIPAGTFPEGTRVYIAIVPAAARPCGGMPAISLRPVPDAQPSLPIEIGLSYPTSPPPSLSQLGMVRYDPTGGQCVYLRSSVDQTSGMVRAETNHLSTFQLMQLKPAGGISDARVFPNPLYSSRQGYVTFDRLPSLTRVRIYTLHGEEVFDGTANASGVLNWNGTNRGGRSVASGVYLAVIQSGGDKKILKVAVIR